MNTVILKNIIKEATLDFGTNHATLSYDTDKWYLFAHYTQLDDSFTDCELYLNQEKKELNDKQLGIIYDFLKGALEDEQERDAELKRSSYGDPYDDRGVEPYMFI